ncbi:unnamed protein product [Schistosoma margrebowiei]|uniref:Uncharacterized protein n=1 Tax=Schistosoma margrebowiei TaxID=48269 RepID=A0A183LE35_9TREM|nr:unnamed protein product [Schistosoma margrebowiei]
MWDTGRAFQIAAEMKRYNLEVLGISETHWTQVGQQRLTSGELLLYSGHEEENAPHTQGVALMLSKQAQNTLIGWESHGPRIIKASFKTKKEGITMNIIQCNAPTNDYNEDAAREGNMRQLYDITKKLSGNRSKPERPVKSKEGEVITNIEEQQNRWVEHFKELLNRPALLNPPNIEAAPTDLPINVGSPTIEEISMAIRQIKSGKAAGTDNIPAEALKADTKSQLYGSLWNNQLNGIHHSTSTSLTTKRHLIAWTEQRYENVFDTTACLKR